MKLTGAGRVKGATIVFDNIALVNLSQGSAVRSVFSFPYSFISRPAC